MDMELLKKIGICVVTSVTISPSEVNIFNINVGSVDISLRQIFFLILISDGHSEHRISMIQKISGDYVFS